MAKVTAKKTTIIPPGGDDVQEPDLDMSLMDLYKQQQGGGDDEAAEGEGAPPADAAAAAAAGAPPADGAVADDQGNAVVQQAASITLDPAQVTELQQLKQAGDFAGIGERVAQLLG